MLRLARHGPVDNCDSRAECGFYIQLGRVEQVCVTRGVEAAMGIAAITRITLLDLGIEGVAINLLAARLELASPAFRPGAGIGDDEKLHVGMRTNNGSDVAPVEHRPAWLIGEVPLVLAHGLANVGDDGNARGENTGLGGGELIEGDQMPGIEDPGGRYGSRLEIGGPHEVPDRTADGPVEQSRV